MLDTPTHTQIYTQKESSKRNTEFRKQKENEKLLNQPSAQVHFFKNATSYGLLSVPSKSFQEIW
jgi:hypothetical protein